MIKFVVRIFVKQQMKVILTSDTHARHRQQKIPDGDLLIHAGDISNGIKDQILDFLEWFAELPHPHKIFIGGNMDMALEKDPGYFRSLLPEGMYYLEDEGIEIGGLTIWGSPVIPNFVGAWNRERGDEINSHWQKMPYDLDILITHTPPKGILDLTSREIEVGCEDLMNMVELKKPRYHFFGHVHDAYGQQRKLNTHFVNASFPGNNSFDNPCICMDILPKNELVEV